MQTDIALQWRECKHKSLSPRYRCDTLAISVLSAFFFTQLRQFAKISCIRGNMEQVKNNEVVLTEELRCQKDIIYTCNPAKPPETAVFRAAANIFASYIATNQVTEDNEAEMMKKAIRAAISIARYVEKVVQSDDELAAEHKIEPKI
jgi:hypothetical protein